ncbi:hypothetical protein Salat_1369800 [Sesamum alatum]|uniref:Uncharacterized protein n=1 Tax=Sesamum alatum TaxID=300844 RepID=A0AAE1YAE2_9LAMI|nr:hypothetical protein Salat_1369800 [Sesamum alatum]
MLCKHLGHEENVCYTKGNAPKPQRPNQTQKGKRVVEPHIDAYNNRTSGKVIFEGGEPSHRWHRVQPKEAMHKTAESVNPFDALNHMRNEEVMLGTEDDKEEQAAHKSDCSDSQPPACKLMNSSDPEHEQGIRVRTTPTTNSRYHAEPNISFVNNEAAPHAVNDMAVHTSDANDCIVHNNELDNHVAENTDVNTNDANICNVLTADPDTHDVDNIAVHVSEVNEWKYECCWAMQGVAMEDPLQCVGTLSPNPFVTIRVVNVNVVNEVGGSRHGEGNANRESATKFCGFNAQTFSQLEGSESHNSDSHNHSDSMFVVENCDSESRTIASASGSECDIDDAEQLHNSQWTSPRKLRSGKTLKIASSSRTLELDTAARWKFRRRRPLTGWPMKHAECKTAKSFSGLTSKESLKAFCLVRRRGSRMSESSNTKSNPRRKHYNKKGVLCFLVSLVVSLPCTHIPPSLQAHTGILKLQASCCCKTMAANLPQNTTNLNYYWLSQGALLSTSQFRCNPHAHEFMFLQANNDVSLLLLQRTRQRFLVNEQSTTQTLLLLLHKPDPPCSSCINFSAAALTSLSAAITSEISCSRAT